MTAADGGSTPTEGRLLPSVGACDVRPRVGAKRARRDERLEANDGWRPGTRSVRPDGARRGPVADHDPRSPPLPSAHDLGPTAVRDQHLPRIRRPGPPQRAIVTGRPGATAEVRRPTPAPEAGGTTSKG